MSAERDPSNGHGVGAAVQEISERASVLVREEVELAKAEVAVKAKSLAHGGAVAVAAGVFVVFALVLLLQAASWGVWLAFIGGQDYWAGFLIVGVFLLLVAALAGLIAQRAFKKGSPPTPQMAIDEARLIQETVKAPLEGGSAVAVGAAPQGAVADHARSATAATAATVAATGSGAAAAADSAPGKDDDPTGEGAR